VYQLLYVSSAIEPFSKTALRDLVNESRENNARTGITGMLLHKRGNFLQAIEGAEPDVMALSARIARDPRHRFVAELLKGPIEVRQFPENVLAFHDLDSANTLPTPGYGEFLSTSLAEEEFMSDPARALKLLLLFKHCMRS